MSSGSSTTSTTPKSERVLVRLSIGHHSQHLPNPLPNGHTHKWTIFVRPSSGVNFTDRSFIDKVTFHLHPTFNNPERNVKKPPFEVSESGYGGFPMQIEIRFAGIKKTYTINYDLSLSLEPYSEHKIEQILEVKSPPKNFAELADKYCRKKKTSDASTSSLLQPKIEKISTSTKQEATKIASKPPKIKIKTEEKIPALFEPDVHDLPPIKNKESEKSMSAIINGKNSPKTSEKSFGNTEQEEIYAQLFGPDDISEKKHRKDEKHKEKKKKKDKKKDKDKDKESDREKEKKKDKGMKLEKSHHDKEKKEKKREKERQYNEEERDKLEEKVKIKLELKQEPLMEKTLSNSASSETLPRVPSVKIFIKNPNVSVPNSTEPPKPVKPSEAVQKEIKELLPKEPSTSPPSMPSHSIPSVPSTSSTSSISPPLNILPKNHHLNASSHIFPRAESPLDRRKRAIVETENSIRACSMSPSISIERKIPRISANFVPASTIETSTVPNGVSSPKKEEQFSGHDPEPGMSHSSIIEHLPNKIESQISPIHASTFASPETNRANDVKKDYAKNARNNDKEQSRMKKLEHRLAKLKDPKRILKCAELMIEHNPEKVSISEDGRFECELFGLPLELVNSLLKICRSNGED